MWLDKIRKSVMFDFQAPKILFVKTIRPNMRHPPITTRKNPQTPKNNLRNRRVAAPAASASARIHRSRAAASSQTKMSICCHRYLPIDKENAR